MICQCQHKDQQAEGPPMSTQSPTGRTICQCQHRVQQAEGLPMSAQSPTGRGSANVSTESNRQNDLPMSAQSPTGRGSTNVSTESNRQRGPPMSAQSPTGRGVCQCQHRCPAHKNSYPLCIYSQAPPTMHATHTCTTEIARAAAYSHHTIYALTVIAN